MPHPGGPIDYGRNTGHLSPILPFQNQNARNSVKWDSFSDGRTPCRRGVILAAPAGADSAPFLGSIFIAHNLAIDPHLSQSLLEVRVLLLLKSRAVLNQYLRQVVHVAHMPAVH